CTGACAGTTTGLVRVELASKALARGRRAGRSFTFRLDRFCVQGDRRPPLGPPPVALVFDARGTLDRARSDLNGDGRPAGAGPAGRQALSGRSGQRRADGYAVYTVGASGAGRVSLGAASGQSEGIRIAYSPDGTRVASPTDRDLVIASARGGGRRELVDAEV